MWPWEPRYPERRRVVVSTFGPHDFSGVLWESRADFLVLKQVKMHGKGEQPKELDGDVVIYREQVELVQVLGGS